MAWTIVVASLILPVSASYAQHEGHSTPTASQQQPAAAPAEVRVVEIPLDKQQLMASRPSRSRSARSAR